MSARVAPVQCRAARGLLGWSQGDLAERIGLTKQTISYFEKGQHVMRNRHMRALLATLDDAGVVLLQNEGTPQGGIGVRLRNS